MGSSGGDGFRVCHVSAVLFVHHGNPVAGRDRRKNRRIGGAESVVLLEAVERIGGRYRHDLQDAGFDRTFDAPCIGVIGFETADDDLLVHRLGDDTGLCESVDEIESVDLVAFSDTTSRVITC